MKRFNSLLVSAATTILLLSPLLAQEREQPSAQQIRALIDELGDASFETRERADKALRSIGDAALPALREAAEDKDLERATRAKRILEAVERRGKETEPPRLGEEGVIRIEGDIVSLQVAPGKVILEITRNGARERFEAESIEEFQKKYPKIAKKYGVGGSGTSLRIGPADEELFREMEQLEEEFRKRFRLFDDLDRDFWRDFDDLFRQYRLEPREERKNIRYPPLRWNKFGVRVIPLSETLRKQLNIDESQNGLVVSEVSAGSPAAKCGLREHDIILNVNGENVEDIFRFADVIRKALAAPAIEIAIVREGKRQTLKTEMEKLR
ncbi:MAG: hypothetical protein A2Z34_07800 [Planctomycetes bacterium RBG_16_59_8]|nr:MAG: hypothetical protein A2Z34_07800 [Planctomycetes bacterium RBG_16_59_8]